MKNIMRLKCYCLHTLENKAAIQLFRLTLENIYYYKNVLSGGICL